MHKPRAAVNTPWKRLHARLKEAGTDQQAVCSAIAELWEHHAAFTSSPAAEVAEALAFLSQQLLLLDTSSTSQDRHLHEAKVKLCQLIAAALTAHSREALPLAACSAVSSALRSWADQHDSQQTPAGVRQSNLQIHALRAIAAFITNNLKQMPQPELSALIALLLSLAHEAPSTPPATGRPASPAPADADMRVLALTALGHCFSKNHPTRAPPAAVEQLLVMMVGMLHTWATGPRAETDEQTRVLAVFLRLLAVVITESKKGWAAHTATLVEGLRSLFTYGAAPAVQPTAAAAPTTATTAGAEVSPGELPRVPAAAGLGAGKYRPPHARGTGSTGSAGLGTAPVSHGAGDRWSDSEVSDSDAGRGGAGSGGESEKVSSARVRTYCLLCLQSMAKTDARAMQPHFTSLMPVQHPTQPRPLVPHLITVLLHDPVSKVRGMAAATLLALLEGSPSRGYLALADGRGPAPVRGFTTLSTSLGQMLVSTHTGLMHALKQEQNTAVLSLVFKSVCVLLTAAPIDRLPPTLLPDTLLTCRTAWAALLANPAYADLPHGEQQGLLAAYTACLAEVLGAKKAAPALLRVLRAPAQPLPLQPHALPSLPAFGQLSLGETVHPLQHQTASEAPTTDASGSNSNSTPAREIQQWPGTSATSGPRGSGVTAATQPAPAGSQQGCDSNATSTQVGPSGDNRGPQSSHVPGQADSGLAVVLAAELLDSCIQCSAPVRIEALAALRGLVEGYVELLPDLWDRVRNVCEHSLTAAPEPSSPRGPSSSGSHASLPSQRSNSRAAQSNNGPSDKPGVAASVTTPTDKAAQQAVKLLSGYLGAAGRVHGVVVSARQVFSEGDPPINPLLPYLARPLPGSLADPQAPPPSKPSARRTPSHPATHGNAAAASQHTAAQPPQEQQSQTGVHSWQGALQHAQLAQQWCDALSLLLPVFEVSSDESYMVRSAVLTALTELPEAVYCQLPLQTQQQVMDLATRSATQDSAAAVRAAACKLLGALCSFSDPLSSAAHTHSILTALTACLKDTVQSVRWGASWALATLTETLAMAVVVLMTQQTAAEGQAQAPAHGLVLPESPVVQQPQPQAQWQGAAVVLLNATAAQGVVGVWEPHMPVLCGGVLEAAQDEAEKVRTVGVRAVGALLFCSGQLAQRPASTALMHGWFAQAVACLQSAITTGTVRVQCSACLAVEALLHRPDLATQPQLLALTSPVLLLINLLIRDCTNFKVRTQAAACLLAIPCRQVLGRSLPDTILVVCHALDTLDITLDTNTTSLDTAAAPSAGGGAPVETSQTVMNERANSFPNFRYIPGLMQQLREALLHLMGMVEAADVVKQKDVWAKRVPVMCRAVQVVAAAAAQDVEDERGEGSRVTAECLPGCMDLPGAVLGSPGAAEAAAKPPVAVVMRWLLSGNDGGAVVVGSRDVQLERMGRLIERGLKCLRTCADNISGMQAQTAAQIQTLLEQAAA